MYQSLNTSVNKLENQIKGVVQGARQLQNHFPFDYDHLMNYYTNIRRLHKIYWKT